MKSRVWRLGIASLACTLLPAYAALLDEPIQPIPTIHKGVSTGLDGKAMGLNAPLTAPYFHDGSARTLDEAVGTLTGVLETRQ